MGAQVDTTATEPKPPRPSAAEITAWRAVADSVMNVHLARSLFVSPAGFAPKMFECAGDAGGDLPSIGIAAVRARILDRDSVESDWAWDYQGEKRIPALYTHYTVEVIGAARMVPNWIAGVAYSNDSIPADEAYVIEVGPRVDTLRIFLEDVTKVSSEWGVCAPTLLRGESGKNFVSFVHAERPWPRAIQWKPANASWARIGALVDSLSR